MRNRSYSSRDTEPEQTISPVWRGIGCILFVITPITALAVGNEIVARGFVQRYIYIPPRLLQPFTIPVLDYTITHFLASLAVAAVVTFVLFTIYFTVYAFLYRIVGPSPYGPMDAPPSKGRRTRKKSR